MAAPHVNKLLHGYVEFTEAEYCIMGIKLAIDWDLTLLVVESDSINIINLIEGKLPSKLEIDLLILEIRSLTLLRTSLNLNMHHDLVT